LSNAYQVPTNFNMLYFDTATLQLNQFLIATVLSPNKRYIYVWMGFDVLQVDREAPPGDMAIKLIGETEVILDTVYGATTLGRYTHVTALIGPDGKMYGLPVARYRYLSVVHQPDSGGLASGYETKGAMVNKFYLRGTTLLCNYRLGRLPGSACDTLYTTLGPSLAHSVYGREPWLQASPNPSPGEVQLDYNWVEWERHTAVELQVSDLSGKVLLSRPLPTYTSRQTLNLEALAAGVYVLTLATPTHHLAQCKVVKE